MTITAIPLSERRWLELRDDRGKLCARLETRDLLLEIRRNDRSAIFNLRDYLDGAEVDAAFDTLKDSPSVL